MNIESTFLPLGAFWIAFQTLQGASSFVNELRELIIIGSKDGIKLTLDHRKALFLDWKLSMFGVLSGSFLYCCVVAMITISTIQDKGAYIAMWLVTGAVFVAGVLFSICGFSDFKLIRNTINELEDD